ncbi:MAG: hypothetical protein RJA16_355 [Planctomycetota bacterium]
MTRSGDRGRGSGPHAYASEHLIVRLRCRRIAVESEAGRTQPRSTDEIGHSAAATRRGAKRWERLVGRPDRTSVQIPADSAILAHARCT